MSNEKHCPFCGSTEIRKIENKTNHFEPFGGSEEIVLFDLHCDSCDLDFDSSDENDAIVTAAVERLKEQSAINILNDLLEAGCNLAAIERVLDLPQRTLTKWKRNGKVNAAGLSLLRFLRVFPWLLDVAECKYDIQMAQTIFVTNAVKSFKYADPLKVVGGNQRPVYDDQNEIFGGQKVFIGDSSDDVVIDGVVDDMHSSVGMIEAI